MGRRVLEAGCPAAYNVAMSRSKKFWDGKCVVISGGSSGIGKALAERVASLGAKAGLLARREDRLAEVAASIAAGGGKADFAAADVTDGPATAQAVRRLESRLGPCEVMIASAGIYRKTDVQDFSPEATNAVIATNVQGVTNMLAPVLPGMIDRGRGNIAAVASVAAMLGLPGGAAYCASKAAIVTMLESLRLDLYPLGVQVTTACPGFVDTPMITDAERKTVIGLLTAEKTARRICRAIERGRPETWFPWHTHLSTRLARMLPFGIFRRVMAHIPPMEEAGSQ